MKQKVFVYLFFLILVHCTCANSGSGEEPKPTLKAAPTHNNATETLKNNGTLTNTSRQSNHGGENKQNITDGTKSTGKLNEGQNTTSVSAVTVKEEQRVVENRSSEASKEPTKNETVKVPADDSKNETLAKPPVIVNPEVLSTNVEHSRESMDGNDLQQVSSTLEISKDKQDDPEEHNAPDKAQKAETGAGVQNQSEEYQYKDESMRLGDLNDQYAFENSPPAADNNAVDNNAADNNAAKPAHTQLGGPESEPAGHFMAYLVTTIVLVVIGYVVYHNRKKVMGFLIEGRSTVSRRRTGGAKYSRVRTSNVEEAMTTADAKNSTYNNVIY